MNKKMAKNDRQQRNEKIILMIQEGFKQRVIATKVNLTEFHVCRLKKKYEEDVKNHNIKVSDFSENFWFNMVELWKEEKQNSCSLNDFLGLNNEEMNILNLLLSINK